jgi:hypothetical protein
MSKKNPPKNRWPYPEDIALRITGQNPGVETRIRFRACSYDEPKEFVQRFCPVVLREKASVMAKSYQLASPQWQFYDSLAKYADHSIREKLLLDAELE